MNKYSYNAMGSFSRYSMRRRQGNRSMVKNRKKKNALGHEKCSDGGMFVNYWITRKV